MLLSPATTDGLQFGAGQSFTFQFVLRTTTANGVLLGEMPGDPGYTFSLVNGAITLNLDDGTNSDTLTGSTIDDGNWHTVVGVRNTANHTVSLYVDGVARRHGPGHDRQSGQCRRRHARFVCRRQRPVDARYRPTGQCHAGRARLPVAILAVQLRAAATASRPRRRRPTAC